MANIFNQPIRRKLRSSVFDLGYDLKVSYEMGFLNVVSIDETLPGDTWRVRHRHKIRLAPQIAPFMHRLKICEYAFVVPKRILWDRYEEFYAGGKDGSVSSLIQPCVNPNTIFDAILDGGRTPTDGIVRMIFGPGTLWDYMGLAPIYTLNELRSVRGVPAADINWLPFRSYYSIWYEYFRDQNLIQDAFEPSMSSVITNEEIRAIFMGGDPDRITGDISRVMPYRKSWEKDYFTAALPWPQRGPEVYIPGSGGQPTPTGKIVLDPSAIGRSGQFVRSDRYPYEDDSDDKVIAGRIPSASERGYLNMIADDGTSAHETVYDPNGTLKVEGTGGSDPVGDRATINELRIASRLQAFYERAARTGGRLTEHLLGFWGEFNKDSRMNRPEWLGSYNTNFYGEAVLQTSFSNDETAQANPAGNAEHEGYTLSFKRHVTEECFIVTLMCVLPNTSYQDGLPRMYSRKERFDFAFPDFAHLGEQAIKNKEVYAPWLTGAHDPDGDFGYVPRYSDYKYCNSRVAGDFRTNLDYWHMGRIFYDPSRAANPQPALNRSFVEAQPSKRIFPSQVEGDDVVWCYIALERKVARKLPKWPNPQLR